jgi:hypothetical protein
MKNNQTILVFVALILAGSVIACSMFGGSNSNGNTNKVANSIAPVATTPAADAPMLPAQRLLDMLAKDVKGFNDQFKDREMIIIGEVDRAEAGSIYFKAGYGKSISCTLSSGGARDKFESVQRLVDNYVSNRAKMPIVEANGVFRSGQVQGSETTAVMENCTIISFKE